MQLFVLGASLAPVALVFGYLSQLYIGKSAAAFDPNERWIAAGFVHYSVFIAIFAAWVLFLSGARYAAIGFGSPSF